MDWNVESGTPSHATVTTSAAWFPSAVSRAEFAAVSRGMPRLDDRKYREDMDRRVNDDLHNPYDRAYCISEFAEDEE